ncbi:hypothetical protein ACOSQ3_016518 [Xanthoceras sorbifolium]
MGRVSIGNLRAIGGNQRSTSRRWRPQYSWRGWSGGPICDSPNVNPSCSTSGNEPVEWSTPGDPFYTSNVDLSYSTNKDKPIEWSTPRDSNRITNVDLSCGE